MPSSLPTLEQVASIPVMRRHVVSEAEVDFNGHLNAGYYFTWHVEGTIELLDRMGLGASYRSETGRSTFARNQLISYRAECRLGEHLSTHVTPVARTDRLLHVVSYAVNEDRGVVASTFEVTCTHVDLTSRASAPFGEMASVIDGYIAAFGPSWAPVTALSLR